jgi:hypothetical protein
MCEQVQVKFWLGQDHHLYVQNVWTKEVRVIERPLSIALFLNEQGLTAHQVKQPMLGRDVMRLFAPKYLLPTIAKQAHRE